MLKGKELGAAIRKAMELKQVRQQAIADEFGIKQPSVSEWLRFGRVDKGHLNHLITYFGDVVGPEHWGLSGAHQNVDQQAQSMSHPEVQDASTAADVSGGQTLGVSFDAEFAKMSPTEQRRFLYLWAAAFDEPPDPTPHTGGSPLWILQTSTAPGSSPGKTKNIKRVGAPKPRRHG